MSATTKTPAAILLGEFPPDSPQWHAARAGGVGGSDIAALLGMSRWANATPYGVWETKLGLSDPLPLTWPLFRGHADEQKLRDWFTLQTGIPVTTTGTWVSRDHDWMRVNPDGLTGDGGGIECKSHSWRMAEEWSDDQVSDAAELQAQWGMAVMGLPHWWVIAQVGDSEPLIRRVERDPELIDILTEVAGNFWHKHVLTCTPPPVTGLDLDALKDRWMLLSSAPVTGDPDEYLPLIAELQDAKTAEKQAGARRADAEAKLRQLAGNAERVEIDGIERLSLVRNGTFSPTKFTAEHPEIAVDFQRTITVLDAARLKDEHPDLHTMYRARVLRVHTPKGA